MPLQFVAPESYMDNHIKAMFASHGLSPEITYVPDYTALIANVALGKGLALMTALPVDERMLTYVEVDDPMARRGIYLSWPTNRTLSASANQIIQHLLKTSREAGAENLIF